MANQHVTIRAANVANQAWVDSDYNNGVGVFLFQLYATLGNREECERVLARLRLGEKTGDRNFAEAIRVFSQALERGEIGAPAPTPAH